ncbi:hypothetical protein Cgig2_008830 [Carnegiea gigantea]|uniref:FAS1 domain-containing protein n=1 Tax=Carnegiea gigantea TaxID=171969 RepID=A0A9Q1Q5V2_9CARY|nr:hypothetical protein Cgig2_008830 [Carnegiea gigantea]
MVAFRASHYQTTMAITTIFLLLSSLALLASTFPCSNGHNITHVLSRHPQFSVFNRHLTASGLAEQINKHMTITVCVLDNPTMRRFLGKWGPSATTLRHVLSVHVLLDYYTPGKLHQLTNSTIQAETMVGPTNHLVLSYPVYVAITNLQIQGGKVVRFTANQGVSVAYFVKSIEEVPFNISVIQITEILCPPQAIPDHRTLLTRVMSSFGCKLFAQKLRGIQAENVYVGNVKTELTIFCPADYAFRSFLPLFEKLSEKSKDSLMLLHGLPVYESIPMLRENNRWIDTLATSSGLHRFGLRVENGEWEEVILKTRIVKTEVVGILIDDMSLAIYVIDDVLLPKELFKVLRSGKRIIRLSHSLEKMRTTPREESLKQGAIVFAALAFGWLAIELALKPWLQKARANLGNSHPSDEQEDVVEGSSESQPSDESAAVDDRR